MDLAERDRASGPSLQILKEHQKAFEHKMEIIESRGGANKLQMQVETLRSWVSDLVAQNSLLAQVVEELEQEAIRLVAERRRHSERDNKNKEMCDRLNELKILNDSLQKENLAKDREIRRLNRDSQQYDQTILSLRNELSNLKYHNQEESKKDVEVLHATSDGRTECVDLELMKDYSALLLQENVKHQERIHKMEMNLKVSGDNIRSLRKMNVSLTEEIHSLRHMCVALGDKCKQLTTQSQFKDELIKELRRQLRQSKDKLQKRQLSLEKNSQKDFVSGDHEFGRNPPIAYDSVTIACVRQPRARRRDVPPAIDDAKNRNVELNTDFECRSSRGYCSADDLTQNNEVTCSSFDSNLPSIFKCSSFHRWYSALQWTETNVNNS